MRRINIFLTGQMDGASNAPSDKDLFQFRTIGPEGPDAIADGPTWVFVDWIMPNISGLEMVRRLRSDPRLAEAHITLVLERDSDEDRRRALASGADDYVVGPIDRDNVLDRILASQSNKATRPRPPRMRFGPLEIVPAMKRARWNGRKLALSPNEFRLLRFLAENSGIVVSRKAMIEGMGRFDTPVDERTVDVWIGRLRRSLRAVGADDVIRTARGKGYVLQLDMR